MYTTATFTPNVDDLLKGIFIYLTTSGNICEGHRIEFSYLPATLEFQIRHYDNQVTPNFVAEKITYNALMNRYVDSTVIQSLERLMVKIHSRLPEQTAEETKSLSPSQAVDFLRDKFQVEVKLPN